MTLTEDIRNNWQSAIIAIAGVWVVASPFVFENTGIGVTLSAVLTGFIIIGYGAYDIKQKQIWGQRIARYWATGALGLWVAVSPWFFHTPNPTRTSNLLTGLLIAVLSAQLMYVRGEREISPTELGSDFRNN